MPCTVPRFAGSLSAVVLAGVCVCLTAGEGLAAKVKPLGIASFALQTTQSREVAHGPGIAGYGFVNEPYPFTQAGGHPDGLTGTLQFTTEEVSPGTLTPTRDQKDMVIVLPPGVSADPQASAQCRATRALAPTACSPDTQVGVFVLRLGDGHAVLGPIVNVTPEAGQSAAFGLEISFGEGVEVLPLVGQLVDTARGYALAIAAGGLANIVGLLGIETTVSVGLVGLEMTLWGVPGESGHDPLRGLSCMTSDVDVQWTCQGGGIDIGASPAPFLTMPSDCAGSPQTATAWVDSWEEPGRYAQAQSALPAMTGCELLRFAPEVSVQADSGLADAPAGLGVSVESQPNVAARAPGTPPLREAVVTLPPGLSISAAGAQGLRGCEPGGPEGIDMPSGLNARGEAQAPDEAGEGEELGPGGLARLAPGRCPAASTVGTAEATTPLLAAPLKGRVYLAAPACGDGAHEPCTKADALDGNLYRLYVELADSGPSHSGVIVKLEAGIDVNPATGQMTATILGGPQLPLSRLTIDLNGGPRALLDNPAVCGPATTTAKLSAWSAPGTTPEGLFMPGTPDATPSSFYEVGGCTTPPGLAPGFIAGTPNPHAGSYSPFTLTVTRNDREQYLSGIQAQLPAGLDAKLEGVTPCDEAAAAGGQCPPASRIGGSLVEAGAGSAPLALSGDVYLTGPYEGAPFGLAIVTHAFVGPFDLGTIVIRARIDVDPHTAALTVTSDPLPQIVLGVPLRLRRVTLELDRPGFILNPTGCEAKRVTGTIAGALGARAEVSTPFAAASCSSLPFSPKLTALTRANGQFEGHGASLHVVATSTAGQANIRSLKMDLPQRLPARLATIRRACRRGVFERNPAACPKASVIGVASAATPVLGVTMRGPIFLVTHGGGGFPNMVVVLQAQGVRIDLTGAMYVNAKNVTSVSFRAMPDVPFRRFEMTLPEGPHSVLVAGAKLCAKRLHISTAMTGQNGARVKRAVTVAVMGCRRKHRHKRHPAGRRSGVARRG